jgi:hypothetical protein
MDTSETERDEVRRQLSAAYADIARGDYAAAQRTFEQTLAAFPQNAEALHAYGAVLANLGFAQRAEPYLRRALALEPESANTRFALGGVLLALGAYAEGWPLYDARYAVRGGPAKPKLPFPAWAGEPLEGKRLLVWPDEGLGDQIQFMRFVPAIQAAGAVVDLIAYPALARLFAASLTAEVIPLETRVEHPTPDFWTTLGALPGLAGLTPATGARPPYLRAPPSAVPAGGRIGVMTRGNPGHLNDQHRSLPEPVAARLRELPGAISLHPADTGFADMADTAQLIAGLDLVISVDTSVAHLAGALGKPVWVLLARVGLDWRWGVERSDSDWYPSARLFRQRRIGDWTSVIDEVLDALPRALTP